LHFQAQKKRDGWTLYFDAKLHFLGTNNVNNMAAMNKGFIRDPDIFLESKLKHVILCNGVKRLGAKTPENMCRRAVNNLNAT